MSSAGNSDDMNSNKAHWYRSECSDCIWGTAHMGREDLAGGVGVVRLGTAALTPEAQAMIVALNGRWRTKQMFQKRAAEGACLPRVQTKIGPWTVERGGDDRRDQAFVLLKGSGNISVLVFVFFVSGRSLAAAGSHDKLVGTARTPLEGT